MAKQLSFSYAQFFHNQEQIVQKVRAKSTKVRKIIGYFVRRKFLEKRRLMCYYDDSYFSKCPFVLSAAAQIWVRESVCACMLTGALPRFLHCGRSMHGAAVLFFTRKKETPITAHSGSSRDANCISVRSGVRKAYRCQFPGRYSESTEIPSPGGKVAARKG